MLESVRALLEGAIDYAGLFPPAKLSMAETVERYRACSGSNERWMLGRLVIPASRLGELEAAIVYNAPPEPWRISVLVDDSLMGAVSAALAFNAHTRDAQADCIETRASLPTAIAEHAGAVPEGFTVYWETPPDADPAPFIEAIAAAGHRAKIRTGGIREDQFPSAADLSRFILACDGKRVAFKATAGLHHAIRGSHALTYETGSEVCTMHGFLNVMLAAAFVWDGISADEMAALLEDRDGALRFSRRGVQWREHWISTGQIRAARTRLLIGFGSCSFEEPVAELRQLGLL